MLIMKPSPSIELLLCVVNGLEPVRVQTLLAELSVEALKDSTVALSGGLPQRLTSLLT